ncbi:N-formylglutamate amidohydrolase [Aquabacter cavernae]|uniref:N-formylglutamate amidohydrolase n=1 Tax=Aquabacter cavernae TaxID=2496029 RepID=UPI00196AD5B8|nr:N-formylglutamate amidohydrolase [Aquabacter cavernae]
MARRIGYGACNWTYRALSAWLAAEGCPDVNGISCLLAAQDMSPVSVLNADGRSAFLIVADHAGNAFPRSSGRLRLNVADQERHIAWDLGIAGACRSLSDLLDTAVIQQNYSRLVIDCNRPPGTPQSIPEVSDGTLVPGNQGLDAAARRAREAEIFHPYHARIAAELDRRQAAGRPVVLIAMHSFTPVFDGIRRPWQVGVLHHRDSRLAHALLAELHRQGDLTVGDNEPYDVGDATDWTIPVHGEQRGILHVGIEIRQDLIARPEDQAVWAARLADALPRALARLEGDKERVSPLSCKG